MPRVTKPYPNDMDTECVSLCDAMNRFPGIETILSCCGHGKKPFMIWFVTRSLEDLPALVYFFDGHTGVYGWRVGVNTDGSQ